MCLLLTCSACAKSFEVLSSGSRDTHDAGTDLGHDFGFSNPDAGAEDVCAAQDAHAYFCALCPDLEPPGWAWDGEACVSLAVLSGSCGCDGSDCDSLYESEASCRAAHATCFRELCRATGGTYLPESCGSRCGHEPEECAALRPVPDCQCEVGKTFDGVRGCVDDPSCDRRDSCLATGGELSASSDSICGAQNDFCGFGTECCLCGPRESYDEATGCTRDARCRQTDAELCTATGGTYDPTTCGDAHCGERSLLACATGGCDCGPRSIFSPGRGCVMDTACYGKVGDTCLPDTGGHECQAGNVCCPSVGTSTVTHTCTVPMCAAGYDLATGCQQ